MNAGRIVLFIITGIFLPVSALFAQLTTNSSLTPQQLVQNILLGPGVTASNISYTGSLAAISNFTYTPSNQLGFGDGVILSTGTNNPAGTFINFGNTAHGTPGDQDLANIAGQNVNDLHDAAVLEFDFVPQANEVKFKYVFASEEYNDYVGGVFNDIFAFILSGVSTPLSPVNIALVPGTTSPVAINSINNGFFTPSIGPCVNCQYYRDNSANLVSVAYNGLTTVLTAQHPVICGQTYHIKIVISDVLDEAFDSGVFLKAGSFSSDPPLTITSLGTNLGPHVNPSTIYENCGDLSLVFIRDIADTTFADTMAIAISGTADTADYSGINDTVIFPQGIDSVFFSVHAWEDNIVDSSENIIVTYTYLNSCGSVDTFAYTLMILENHIPLQTITTADTAICMGQTVNIESLVSGSLQPYSYIWYNQNDSVISNSSICTVNATTQTYYIDITDACRYDTIRDSVHIEENFSLYLSGEFDVIGSNIDSIMLEGCGQAILTFTENGIGAGQGIHSYNISVTGTAGTNSLADIGVVIPDTITFNNQTTVTYNLNAVNDNIVENGAGPGYELVIVTIDYASNPCIPVSGKLVKKIYIKDPVPFTVDLTNDTSICRGRGLPLNATTTGGGGNITYNWQHNPLLHTNSTVVTPLHDSTFVVTAIESCNQETKKDSIHVRVLYDPPVITSLSLDSVCIRENYSFNTVITHGVGTNTGFWLPGYLGDLQQNGDKNSWIIYGVAQTQTYIYSVKDQCNFVDTDTLILLALDCDLHIPNIITSNGDGINDVFFIKNLIKNPNTSVNVYDRWGIKIYESTSYNNDWKPSDLSDGVYYYTIKTPHRGEFKGFFHVFNEK